MALDFKEIATGAVARGGTITRALLSQMLADIAFCKAKLSPPQANNSKVKEFAPRQRGWLKITDFDGAPGPAIFTCDLFTSLYASDPIATNVKARNSTETENDATHGGGYTLGDLDGVNITGFYDVPTRFKHQVVDFTYDPDLDEMVYVFTYEQQPKGECP